MMKKPRDPRELVIDLLPRSICRVQVAAVLADDDGIFSWGWNNSGPDGMGVHAEAHAISRANRDRLQNATLYIAGRRKQSKNTVSAKPCEDCWGLCGLVNWVVYRDKDGVWKRVYHD